MFTEGVHVEHCNTCKKKKKTVRQVKYLCAQMHEPMVERTDTQPLFNVKMTETSLFPQTLLSQKASTQSPRISNV